MKPDYPSAAIQKRLEEAQQYEQKGDNYHAIKIYKRIIQLAADWHMPYARLSNIYKNCREWKACLHYSKKAVAIQVQDRECWWNMGIAATALKKERLANRVWAKFGQDQIGQEEKVCVQLQYGHHFEIIWAKPIDPARGFIANIPHPASGRRYQDLILFDNEVIGFNVVKYKKIPVLKELGVLKHSFYQTFSCQLHTTEQADLIIAAKMCKEAGLGFENWSNATLVQACSSQIALPEYYGNDFLALECNNFFQIAIAAPKRSEVEEVLRNWQLVTLKNVGDLNRYV